LILELPALVSRLIPAQLSEGRLSFVAVHYAKLVFLAFRERSRDPDFVVTVGSEEEVAKLHDVLSKLHREIPALTPESLATAPLPDGRFIHVQSAIPGLPWYSLAGSLRHDARRRLHAKALDVLRKLHGAIDAIPAWHSQISPSGELRRQFDLSASNGITLSPAARQLAESCIEHLAGLGEFVSHWQHGDYCASNLMVAGTDLRIFDFDEFGMTAMPLHDQFALAFSVHELASADGVRRPVAEEVHACIAAELRAKPALASHVRGLLVHHLLWNVNLHHGQPARVGRGKAALRDLEEFASVPWDYVPPSAA
jgi:hypothetical protein